LSPKILYTWRFAKFVPEMKEVIHLGDASSFCNERNSSNEVKESIVYCFRHIDIVESKGMWLDTKEVYGELAYFQPVLADITWGIDTEEGGSTVEGSAMALPENRVE
jgi:hypothetical protein